MTLTVGDDADLVPSLALALADPDATEIVLTPGVYVEHVVIAPRPKPLLIRSSTGDPRDVVVSFGLRQGDRDRTGMPYVQDCATLTIDADDVTLEAITVENTFDKTLSPGLPDSQAIALRTRGDRIRVERCRLIGQQDTVLLDAPSWAAVRRVHLVDCEIAGDVDFVYGRATALIEGGVIRSVGPGYVAAPSTARENPRGFLFAGVALVADAGVADGSVALGRPWHPGGKPDAIGQALFVDCALGAHISPDGWDDMGGFAWRDARFGESGCTGPGSRAGSASSASSAVRPLLPEAPDLARWLDGWAESARPASVAEARRAVVVSDSTASEYPADVAPRTGWAQRLAEHSGLEVDNRAVSGASSGSFITLGELDRALDALRPGDLVLIAFGHNDSKPDDRFADVFTAYPANLRRYLVGARARGAVPVLLTPVERRSFDGERARSTHGGYPQRVRDLAAAEGVALIDLTRLTRALWQQQGTDASRASFLHLAPGEHPGHPDGAADDTHLSLAGADAVAALVAAELRRLGLG